MVNEYFDTQDTDLDISQVREDYEFIWHHNIVQCDLIREENPQQGDYFADADNITIKKKLWINIQGVSSDYYKRLVEGIITPDSTYKCYVKYDEEIENLDVISFAGYYFRIVDFNKSLYQGQFCFQEFSIKRISKSE